MGVLCHWTDVECHRMVMCCTQTDVHFLVQISQFLMFLSTAVNNIHLVLDEDLHVQQVLALVSSEEAYTEVLELDFELREEGDEQPPVPQVAIPNPILESAIQKSKGKHIEGDAPPHFPNQALQFTHLQFLMPRQPGTVLTHPPTT